VADLTIKEDGGPVHRGAFADYVRELGTRRSASHSTVDLVVLQHTASTNSLAKSVALDYQDNGIDLLQPVLLLAYAQTGGRGRHGRTWVSPEGSGVYATLLLPVADIRQLLSLPLLVGVGLCRGLDIHLKHPCRLKWPNDLLVDRDDGTKRRKVGGILIESLIRPGEPVAACIGFGVNLGPGQDLPETATSVEAEGGAGVSLATLTWDLVEGLERELAHLGNSPYAIDTYRSHSIHKVGDHLVCQIESGTVEGTFLGFDEQGLLRLGRPEGELRLTAGEVMNQ
jgi:BirA family biotin operon repressor/biotin-[acetyl-CoA-carboxylase] ligase